MQLVELPISGRASLIQVQEILAEFGQLIPWLMKIGGLCYSTNRRYFEEQLHQRIGCKPGSISLYQLVSSGRERDYVGGLLRFADVPEKFLDSRLQMLMAQLVTQGAMYISCLQVHGVKRGLGYGYGAEIVLKAIKRIQQEWPIVWGVCEPRLLKWYVSLGAEVLDPGINRDHLALIVWR